MRIALTTAIAAVMLCACAAAPEAETVKLASSDDGKICKRMMVTGSNMPKRVCSTQEEWDALTKQGEEGVDDFKRVQSDAGTPGIGGP